MSRLLLGGLLAVILTGGAMSDPETAMGQGSPPEVVNRVCSRCHALEVMGHCLAGDCRGKRVVRLSKSAPWNFVLDWMKVMGAEISEKDARTIRTFLESKFPAPRYPLAWARVPSRINLGGWNVVSLREDRKALYAGFEGNGKIFRTVDGIEWKEVASTDHNTVYGITSFRGNLYAGTNDPDAQVVTSADGIHWTPAKEFGGDEHGVISMGIFEGRLYAGTGRTSIYRSRDGKEWQKAAELKPMGQSIFSNWIRFLIEFKGGLYAGLEKGPLFRSSNGTDWVPVGRDVTADVGVRGAAVFNGALYVGTAGGGRIWKTNDGINWERVFQSPSHIHRGYVSSMAVADEALYAGIDGYVFVSPDGATWREVGHLSPFTIESIALFNGKLFAGTLLPPSAQIYIAPLETTK
jgi:hypothetical protein